MKKSIPTCKIDEFNKKLNFLNNKLVKYGKQKLEAREIKRYTQSVKYQNNDGEWDYMTVEFADFEIVGLESFKKDDKEYRYIGNIQYHDGIKQISCLDETYIEFFDRDYKVCDHCHTNRPRKRYNLFESGRKVIQIGSTCSQDYFGYDVDKFLNIYLQIESFGEEDWDKPEYYRGSVAKPFDIAFNVIRYVTADFAKWEKKQEYNAPNSVDKIRGLLFDIDQIKKSNINFESVEEELLEKIRNYWNKQERSSFVINVREALKVDYVTEKSIGFYSYAVFKAIQEIRKEKAKKEGKLSTYKNGDRPTLNVTVTSHKIIEIPAYNGRGSEPMAIVNFTTDDGVRYMTKSTGFDVVRKIKAGDKLTIKGTVYGPDRYNKLCCVLSRVKVLENKSLSHSNSPSQWDDNVITNFLKEEE